MLDDNGCLLVVSEEEQSKQDGGVPGTEWAKREGASSINPGQDKRHKVPE